MAKRIALLVPSLVGGGAERSARFVGLALEAAGYSLDLVVAVNKGELRDDAWMRAHLVDLGARHELTALRSYVRYLDRARPDLVISFVHSANLLSGIGGVLRPATPYIVSVRNTLVKAPRDQWWVRRWFGPGLERRLYARAARVQAVSDALAGEVRRLWRIPERRLVVTYNSALDPGAPPPPPDPAEAAEIAGLDPYLVSVGRLVPIKGFDTLIRAFARSALPPAWRLAIVGEGAEREALERLARELGVEKRVTFTGYRPAAHAWIAGARGFVFASRAEGLSRVTHQALLAALPIAAARSTGVTEVLGDGRLGRLLDPADAAGFSRAMEDIAAGRLTAADPAARAAQLARYAPETVAARYVAMVGAVLSERNPGRSRRSLR